MDRDAAAAMIEHQLRRRGIRDDRVLEALLEIPREEFVAPEDRSQAYSDAAMTIACNQTITQPYMTALMVECLELKGSENVLEVGSGSGYHAAVLGRLAASVVTIERIPELAETARANLDRTGLGANITVISGDGSLGYPLKSPYDAISVAAGSPSVPPALLEQLNDPGTLVIPVGDREDQKLQVIRKESGKITTRVASGCRFVPLIGQNAWES